MTRKELLQTLETCVVYFDEKRLEEHKELLWQLFLEGKIESRMVVRYGQKAAEIMKPLDLTKL